MGGNRFREELPSSELGSQVWSVLMKWDGNVETCEEGYVKLCVCIAAASVSSQISVQCCGSWMKSIGEWGQAVHCQAICACPSLHMTSKSISETNEWHHFCSPKLLKFLFCQTLSWNHSFWLNQVDTAQSTTLHICICERVCVYVKLLQN